MAEQRLTSIRVLARGTDGQMFAYAWDDIPEEHLAESLEDAVATMRDREATWYPEETFRDEDRALFREKHLGWGRYSTDAS